MKIAAISIFLVGLFAGLTGYGPQAIPLEPGRIYRTGSPLSQPGIGGLVGGILGTHQGGGAEMWTGEYIAPGQDRYNYQGATWQPSTAEQFHSQDLRLTYDEAVERKANAPASENVPTAVVPDCEGGRLWVSYLPDAQRGARAVYECEE